MSTFTPYNHQRAGIDWIVGHPAAALEALRMEITGGEYDG